MKTFIYIYILIIFISLSNCNKFEREPDQNIETGTLLNATHNSYSFEKIERTFKIFSDSTFVFTESLHQPNHTKKETFEGKAQINNDTIRFFPFRLDFNRAETAVLKNGFIEFIDGEFPYRMFIQSSNLKIKNHIDYSKFKDYSVFTFYKKFQRFPQEKNYTNFDLKSKDLAKIEAILKKEFIQNKKLNKYSEYIKQIESVKNEQNENLIFIHCYCKNSPSIEDFLYYQIEMNDGGKCNIYIKLNLSTEKVEIFNVAGYA